VVINIKRKGNQSFKHWIFKCDALASFRWNSLNFIDDLYFWFWRLYQLLYILVPIIVGLMKFLTSAIPIISSSFELLFDRYSKLPNLTKSVDVVLIRHNDNTGSSSISTKGESRLSSSINDESGESLVDTTLSILNMLLLGFITFLFVKKGKFPHSTTCRKT